MAVVKSYEVLSLKKGRWQTEAATDNKKDAIEQAREIIKGRYFMAVRVLEESFDEDTGKSKTFVVFNEKKAIGKPKKGYTGPERRMAQYKGKGKPDRRGGKNRRKPTFLGEIVKLVAILGGLLVCIVLLITIYVSKFSGGF